MKSVFVIAALALAGCAPISVRSQAAPDVNFAGYKTYAFFTALAPGAPETVVEQDIRGSLERNLATHGMVPATGKPDFLVAYHTQLQQKLSATNYGYGYWGGWGPDFYTYTQGTIVLDFIDPKTNKVFWHGTATSVVSHPENPDASKIDAAITKLLERYPPPAPMATE
ncbi:MAG: DUF4136 domain-containing protein [Deltaproteobacteria bacterium]|nr:DUF4136 domain-containing protein [Deltaproteobacteria bacterium]